MFEIEDKDTGKLVKASSITEEYLLGPPMAPLFVISSGGTLFVLKPDGTYGYPAIRYRIRVKGGLGE